MNNPILLNDSKLPMTFRQLSELYMKLHSRPHKRSWKHDRKLLVALLPLIGDIDVLNLDLPTLARAHAEIGARAPYHANRAIELVSSIWSFAQRFGYIDESRSCPAKRVRRFREVPRDRYLKDEEISALLTCIEKLRDPYPAYFKVLLYTGLRVSEARSLQWSDIDFDSGEMLVMLNKADRPHRLPMPDQVTALLQGLPRINQFVFASRHPHSDRPVGRVEKVWARVKKSTGLADIRLHDLRRTVASRMVQSGASLHLVGSVLNQSSITVTAGYARFGREHIKRALQDHADLLPTKNVLQEHADPLLIKKVVKEHVDPPPTKNALKEHADSLPINKVVQERVDLLPTEKEEKRLSPVIPYLGKCIYSVEIKTIEMKLIPEAVEIDTIITSPDPVHRPHDVEVAIIFSSRLPKPHGPINTDEFLCTVTVDGKPLPVFGPHVTTDSGHLYLLAKALLRSRSFDHLPRGRTVETEVVVSRNSQELGREHCLCLAS